MSGENISAILSGLIPKKDLSPRSIGTPKWGCKMTLLVPPNGALPKVPGIAPALCIGKAIHLRESRVIQWWNIKEVGEPLEKPLEKPVGKTSWCLKIWRLLKKLFESSSINWRTTPVETIFEHIQSNISLPWKKKWWSSISSEFTVRGRIHCSTLFYHHTVVGTASTNYTTSWSDLHWFWANIIIH